ncbi:transport protein particle complex II subunit TRS130 [Sporobolomyces koalae]|uniref:transport protein particle complex II subunit TRS130 n=1 Tax=Sporobolomyces koalae TaxID=500713 RepID=UPI00316D9246
MVPRVAVAFEALPTARDYDAIRPDMDRQLPLRNLHWVRKSAANRSIRTVNDLDVDFKPLHEFVDRSTTTTSTTNGSSSLLERPYLNLLFVVCDDNEVYRATVRTQIREWLDSVIHKQHQEWLIVHVTSGKSAGAKFYQRKSGIVDKIKADFNTGKKDRCIQVAQGASADDPTAWAEFSNKVKEGIITTFDSNVTLYEENVRKADSQRQLEGWHFLPFFLQKESLADSFEAMTLFEEALIQYDELEASFFQNLKEHRISWINNVGGLSVGDDALPLLSTANKPYRKLIESGTISVFDFRIYLFARQAEMLFHLGRTVEVARRGAYFVSTFARTLREHQNLLGQNFVESWTYSACLNIVEICENHLVSDKPVTHFVAVKAELLDLAKKQLDKIGMGAGHLPMVHPFSMSLNEIAPSRPTSPASSQPAERPPVSRKDLLEAISDRSVFDKLYIDLSHKTIQAYQLSGRKRCAIKLHAGLAGLETHRARPGAAQKLFAQLPAHYVDLRWTWLESHLLAQCTALQTELDMSKERLLSTLALIRSGIEFGSKRWSLRALREDGDGHEKDKELATTLMEDVYKLSATLTKDFAAVAFPTFSIRLAPGTGERATDEDGIIVTALVRNLLPTVVHVDEARLKFSTRDGEQVWFTSGKAELAASCETAITLFCPTAATGRLSLELSQLRFSRIIFQYSHRPISARNLAPDPRLAPTVPDAKQPYILLGQDFQAVQIEIESPETIHLDRERQVVICVDPGRNSLTKISLAFEMLNPTMMLDNKRARMIEDGKSGHGSQLVTTSQETESTVVTLEDLQPFNVVKLQVPLTGEILDAIVKFNVAADYSTTKRPTLRRTLRRSFTYSVGLPLAVNVQDYFRRDCLLSKFSITTDGLQGLKVKDAILLAPTEVTVKPCRDATAAPVNISAVQTANFLFKLFCDQPHTVNGLMRLVLHYSSIEDQVNARIRDEIVSEIDAKTQPHSRWLLTTVGGSINRSVDLRKYADSQELSEVSFDAAEWNERVTSCTADSSQQQSLLETIERIYQKLSKSTSPTASGFWRKLEIPLDLPSLSILNLVSVVPAVTRIEVGQPIPTTVTIESSFQWQRGPQHDLVELRYEVVSNSVEWIVSGKTRGTITVSGSERDHDMSLTLIPLKPGALFLPSISIQPVETDPQARFSCETQHIAAAATIEVLPVLMKTSWQVVTSGRSYGNTVSAM